MTTPAVSREPDLTPEEVHSPCRVQVEERQGNVLYTVYQFACITAVMETSTGFALPRENMGDLASHIMEQSWYLPEAGYVVTVAPTAASTYFGHKVSFSL